VGSAVSSSNHRIMRACCDAVSTGACAVGVAAGFEARFEVGFAAVRAVRLATEDVVMA